jgi:hypothetical protein
VTICDDVRAALAEGEVCEETDRGARIETHCLYPSFDPVEVFVARYGDGFVVTDGGGAAASAFLHGRDEIGKVLARECARYDVVLKGDVVTCEVDGVEWLRSAVLAVANASAAAAISALERVAVAAERVLADKIYEGLARVVSPSNIAREYEHRGVSGKRWRYDFAATANGGLLLVNAVAPHHVSVSAKYVAFADTPANDDHIGKLAVYGRKLEIEDVALITQVATLVPVTAVEAGIRRVLAR